MLQVYQELVGLTVVRPGALPLAKLVLKTQPSLTRSEAIYALNASLAINGISVLPAANRFIMVFPNSMSNHAAAVVSRVAKSQLVTTNEALGTLRIVGGKLPQLTTLFGQLSGRPVRISPGTPEPVLTITSPFNLKTGEMLQGLELLLGLNGLALVPDETGPGLRLVPFPQAIDAN